MGGTLHAAGDAAERAHDLASAWSLAPVVVVAVVAAALLYAAGWRRLRARRRPDLASAGRAAAFAAGLVVILLALVSPLDAIGERYLLSAHMVQHLLIGDVGPALLALGLAGPLALFVVPRPVLRTVGRSRRARAVLRPLGRPATAFVVWVAVMGGWHVPALYGYALEHPPAHELEHATMVLAGLAVWLHIVAALPAMRMSAGRRAAYAVGLFVAGMVVSEVLFLSGPLYDVYIDQPERLLGLSPGADQMRAALFMSGEQILTLGTAAALLVWSHVDRVAAERQGPAEPAT